MRKIFCFLLATALAAGICAPAALAAETPTVSISSGTAAPSGEVTLTVSIRDNPGISSTILHIFFDPLVFEVDPEQDLRASGGFASGMIVGNTMPLALQNGYTDCPPGSQGVLLGWFDLSGTDVHSDGESFAVTFHVNSSAKAGEYKIELGYSQENTCSADGAEVALTTLPGTVTVTGSGTQTAPGETGKPDESPAEPQPDKPNFPDPDEKPALFSDISGNWAEEYIVQAAERGLIVGYEGKYRPRDSMTRAELVTILWRAGGSPKAEPSAFTDLTQDWYREAVAWAEKEGAVKGVGGGRFDPEGLVTREQLATILRRMAGAPSGMEEMLARLYDQQFADSGKLSGWAKTSVYWAYYNEILCGNERLTAEGELAPQAEATRAQIAVMMVRYLDKMAKGG